MHTVRELPVAAVWLLTQGFSVCFFGPRNEIFSLSLFLKQKPVHRTSGQLEMAKKYPMDIEGAMRMPSSRASK